MLINTFTEKQMFIRSFCFICLTRMKSVSDMFQTWFSPDTLIDDCFLFNLSWLFSTRLCPHSGRESRLPLTIMGEAAGPKLQLNFNAMDMKSVFIGAKSCYEVRNVKSASVVRASLTLGCSDQVFGGIALISIAPSLKYSLDVLLTSNAQQAHIQKKSQILHFWLLKCVISFMRINTRSPEHRWEWGGKKHDQSNKSVDAFSLFRCSCPTEGWLMPLSGCRALTPLLAAVSQQVPRKVSFPPGPARLRKSPSTVAPWELFPRTCL